MEETSYGERGAGFGPSGGSEMAKCGRYRSGTDPQLHAATAVSHALLAFYDSLLKQTYMDHF